MNNLYDEELGEDILDFIEEDSEEIQEAINEIGKTFLTKEQEYNLIECINNSKTLQERQKYIEELYKNYEPLFRKLTGTRFSNQNSRILDYDDFYQAAFMGFLKALSRFDNRIDGNRFITFLFPYIKAYHFKESAYNGGSVKLTTQIFGEELKKEPSERTLIYNTGLTYINDEGEEVEKANEELVSIPMNLETTNLFGFKEFIMDKLRCRYNQREIVIYKILLGLDGEDAYDDGFFVNCLVGILNLKNITDIDYGFYGGESRKNKLAKVTKDLNIAKTHIRRVFKKEHLRNFVLNSYKEYFRNY